MVVWMWLSLSDTYYLEWLALLYINFALEWNSGRQSPLIRGNRNQVRCFLVNTDKGVICFRLRWRWWQVDHPWPTEAGTGAGGTGGENILQTQLPFGSHPAWCCRGVLMGIHSGQTFPQTHYLTLFKTDLEAHKTYSR